MGDIIIIGNPAAEQAVFALAGAAYISGWPPTGHIVWRSLGDTFTLGLVPFLWGFGFAAARE